MFFSSILEHLTATLLLKWKLRCFPHLLNWEAIFKACFQANSFLLLHRLLNPRTWISIPGMNFESFQSLLRDDFNCIIGEIYFASVYLSLNDEQWSFILQTFDPNW